MRKRRSQTRLGKFWLSRDPEGEFYITWFDERTGQTRRETTGTDGKLARPRESSRSTSDSRRRSTMSGPPTSRS